MSRARTARADTARAVPSRTALLTAVVTAGAAVATALVLTPGTASAAQHQQGGLALRSGLVGSTPGGPVLAGSTAGTAPWVADRDSRVRLDRRGDLEVRVRGLVIPTAPQNGTNPVPALSVSVTCAGVVVATTPSVPFDARGNARVDTRVALPSPCLVPGVLVRPGTNAGVYIAANG